MQKKTTQHLLCCDQKSSLLHKTAQESTSFGRIFILSNDNISNENISLAYYANSRDIVLATRAWNAYLLSQYRRTLGVKLTQNSKLTHEERSQAKRERVFIQFSQAGQFCARATLEIADDPVHHCLFTLKSLRTCLRRFFQSQNKKKRKNIHFRLRRAFLKRPENFTGPKLRPAFTL